MRDYEVVYIYQPALTEDAVSERLEKLHALATKSKGSEMLALDHWGVRQLAYEVEGQNQGYYAVAQFTASPSDLSEFERVLKLDEELLRYLIVLSEGEPSSGMSIVAETTSTHDPDEDGDDDEEDELEDDDDDEDGRGEASPPEFSGGRGRRRRIDGPRIELLNYKDVSTLSRFVTEQGKILPKRTTKVPARFQRKLGRAVKRARYLALLPYVQSHDR